MLVLWRAAASEGGAGPSQLRLPPAAQPSGSEPRAAAMLLCQHATACVCVRGCGAATRRVMGDEPPMVAPRGTGTEFNAACWRRDVLAIEIPRSVVPASPATQLAPVRSRFGGKLHSSFGAQWQARIMNSCWRGSMKPWTCPEQRPVLPLLCS